MGCDPHREIFEQLHKCNEHYRDLLVKNYENNRDCPEYASNKERLLAEHRDAIDRIFVENRAVISDGRWFRQKSGGDPLLTRFRPTKDLKINPNYTVIFTKQCSTYLQSELEHMKKRWERQIREDARGEGRHHKICEWCGHEFVSVRSDAKYCPGEKCRKAAQRAKKRESELLTGRT